MFFFGSLFASHNGSNDAMSAATLKEEKKKMRTKKMCFLTFAPAPLSIAATVQTVVALLWLAPEGLLRIATLSWTWFRLTFLFFQRID